MFNFLLALALTVSIETTVLQLLNTFSKLLGKKNTTKNVVFAGVTASSLTLPYLYFVLPSLALPLPLYIGVGEVGVTLVEALFFMFFFEINVQKAFLISFIANFISFAAGIVLFGY